MYNIVNIEQKKDKYFINFISEKEINADLKLSIRIIDNDRFILTVPKEEVLLDIVKKMGIIELKLIKSIY